MDKRKFGSYIKESRINKGYTQKELANLLFVDVTTVSKWERGVSYPDITLVSSICKVLDISEHELIESSQDSEYRKIKKEARKYNNMKKGTFWILNISYIVAILTCFIVNLSVSHTLSWFYIVLTSIVCAYTFLPTVTWVFNKYKKLAFIISTYISMSLLFITCSVYSNNYWFMIACLGTLLGYFIIFFPILFISQKKYITEEKYNKISRLFLFSYVMGIFVLTNLLLLSIYLYIPYNLPLGLLITGGCFIMPILIGVLNLFEFGKRLNKPILISLVGVLIVLLLLGIGRSIYLRQTQVSKIYNIEEKYDSIKIEGSDVDVNVYLSSNNEDKVSYIENQKVSIETKIENGILIVTQNDNRKFYDRLFDFNDFEINLYLSINQIKSLNINLSSGDIEVNHGFKFDEVNISGSTGDIEFNSDVTGDINITNSTGDIEIENSNVGGELKLVTSTGDIDLSNVISKSLNINISTGNTKLDNVLVDKDFNMTGSTGDLKLNKFDAENIYITLKTGDVIGNIITEKIFVVRSKTGSIKVPETLTGGVCKINITTGNVNITYYNDDTH